MLSRLPAAGDRRAMWLPLCVDAGGVDVDALERILAGTRSSSSSRAAVLLPRTPTGADLAPIAARACSSSTARAASSSSRTAST